jgi:hypothetical protein
MNQGIVCVERAASCRKQARLDGDGGEIPSAIVLTETELNRSGPEEPAQEILVVSVRALPGLPVLPGTLADAGMAETVADAAVLQRLVSDLRPA